MSERKHIAEELAEIGKDWPTQSDTPRTDELEKGIESRLHLRGFGVPQDTADRVLLLRQIERELAAERKRADEAERDAKRWKQTLMFIGADVDRSGEQCFVIRMPLFRQVNLMRGSVSEHFTKRIDEAIRNG